MSALRKRVSPRFDDPQFELRYRGHRGKGLDSVQLWFASMATLYVVALWIYHAVDPNVEEGHRFDRQVLAAPRLATRRRTPRLDPCGSAF